MYITEESVDYMYLYWNYFHDVQINPQLQIDFPGYTNVARVLSEVLRAGWTKATKYTHTINKLKPAGDINNMKHVIDEAMEKQKSLRRANKIILS